jgi:diguanylate cyclase (GGDEF)-like protein
MASNDKALGLVLELGDPGERRNRAERLEQAMRLALALMDGDAVVVRPPMTRSGKRTALHARSVGTATLAAAARPSEIVRRFAQDCTPLAFPNLSHEASLAGVDDCPGVQAGPAMFLPLRQRDASPGYFAIYRGPGRAPFTTGDVRQMLLLTTWLGTALENLRLSSGVEKLAITDDVTEVYNSRFIVSALGRELRRAARFGQELSVVRLEVDRLEQYKIEWDEVQGSALLRNLASLLAHHVRSFDLLGRYEADDFILMLPQTGRDRAVEVAERLRGAIETHTFSPAAAGAVTASIGVACFPADGADAATLIATSERALEQARAGGMNRVETLAPRPAAAGSWVIAKKVRTDSAPTAVDGRRRRRG